MRRALVRGAAALAAFAAGWILSPGVLAQGCAMCRTAVEGQDDPLARALSTSTLFLLAMPFAVAASVGGWLFFSLRRVEEGDEMFVDSALAPDGSESNQGE